MTKESLDVACGVSARGVDESALGMRERLRIETLRGSEGPDRVQRDGPVLERALRLRHLAQSARNSDL